MSFFSDAIAAVLAGRTVRAVPLLFFDFMDEPSRYWTGFGRLTTTDGNVWKGLDGVGRIDGLQSAIGTVAPKATFSVAALDPTILTLAQQQSTSVKRRAVTVFLQCFDDLWQVLDQPYAIWSGLMDTMSYQMSDEDGRKLYRVLVTARSVWVNRSRPSFGYYDPQDQASRGYPTDTGLNQIPALAGQSIVWKTT